MIKIKSNLFLKIKKKTSENWLLILLLLVGIIVRIFAFGKIPAGLNQDEASIGYDAYSLLNYGIDRNGIYNPVHFISWGSGQNALYAYLSMPFIYLFDLNIMSVRIVNLLFGIITLVVFYYLNKRLFSKPIALVSLFLLAINPWHIMLSRWALESNLFPAIFLLGVYTLVLAFEKPGFLIPSFILFSLSLYAYSTSFFIVPIFLLIILGYLLYHKLINRKYLFISTSALIVFSLPIGLFLFINTFNLNSINTPLFTIAKLPGKPRYTDSSIFSSDFLIALCNNFLDFIKLFVTQNDGHLHNSIPGYGFMYLFALPFVCIGLFKLLVIFFSKEKLPSAINSEGSSIKNADNKKPFKNQNSLIILSWFFVSVLLASLITEININRINIIFLPTISLISLGIFFIKRKVRILQIPIIVLFSGAFIAFSASYFSTYPQSIGPKFYESFDEAINYASHVAKDKIFVTNSISYTEVLFFEKINPYVFTSTVNYINPGAAFQAVGSFGRYIFDYVDSDTNHDCMVIHNSDQHLFSSNEYDIKSFKYYSVVTKK